MRTAIVTSVAFLTLMTRAAFGVSSSASAAGHVADNANVLSSEAKQSLENNLSLFETQTKIKFLVVTVPIVATDSNVYAHGLFKACEMKDRANEDGILLLVDPNNKTAQIEKSKNLADRLPSDFCNDVIYSLMASSLKARSYSTAIDIGVAAIMARFPRLGEAPFATGDVGYALHGRLANAPLAERFWPATLMAGFLFFFLPLCSITIMISLFSGWLYLFGLIPISLGVDIVMFKYRRYFPWNWVTWPWL